MKKNLTVALLIWMCPFVLHAQDGETFEKVSGRFAQPVLDTTAQFYAFNSNFSFSSSTSQFIEPWLQQALNGLATLVLKNTKFPLTAPLTVNDNVLLQDQLKAVDEKVVIDYALIEKSSPQSLLVRFDFIGAELVLGHSLRIDKTEKGVSFMNPANSGLGLYIQLFSSNAHYKLMNPRTPYSKGISELSKACRFPWFSGQASLECLLRTIETMSYNERETIRNASLELRSKTLKNR